jgi:AraC-like DNA-binding protein
MQERDNAYILGLEGFIYTTDRSEWGLTERHAVVVMLSAGRQLFEIGLPEGQSVRANAIVVGPLVKRRLSAPDGQLVDLHVMPTHPLYRQFVGMAAPGVTAIDREAFAPWDELLQAMYRGQAHLDEVRASFDEMVDLASQLVPRRARANPSQADQVYDLLARQPDASLDEIAEHLRVSPRWMSRIFLQAFDMSYRDYQSWRKHRRAMEMLYSRRTLTDLAHEAGFTDSPQFNRAFQRWFGLSPSYSRDRSKVRVFAHDRPLSGD